MKMLVLLALALVQTAAPAFPTAEISNGRIRAALYLPDARSGYYRGTRFDWAGVIKSVEWNGHSYFGQWFERHDPTSHDGITGPVEEFLTNDAGLGYAEAKPGGTFVRIGVGAVRRPEEPAYRRFSTYEIVDPGRRSMTRGKDWIELTHELRGADGYGYVYRKKVRLEKDTLVLEHRLANVGTKTIATTVYNHDFYMLDRQPTSSDVVVRFAFTPRAKSALNGLAEIRGNDLVYLKELQPRQTVSTDLEGFGTSPRDYDIRVENLKTGAGVRQTSDRPIARLLLWSPRTTVCPEAYIDMRVEPGKAFTWRIAYQFYQASSAGPQR